MELSDTVLIRRGKSYAGQQIYAFDLDSTLIETGDKRKKAAASTPGWNWWNEVVPTTLHKLEGSSAILVIFSNQSHIEGEKRTVIERKIAEMCDTAKINPWVFIATEHNWYRKPGPGIWSIASILLDCHDAKPVVYVGDAAGRAGDFADSDAKFAYNIGTQFATPEQFFLGAAAASPFKLTDYSEILVSKRVADDERISIMNCVTAVDKPVAVFMCGPPAAGKSTLAALMAKKHKMECINQDVLGTRAKTFKAIASAIDKNHSFIIDKLFATAEERAEYLQIIPDTYSTVCIIVSIKREYAEVLNKIRAELTHSSYVPEIVYATFYKRYVEPSTDEFDYVFIYNSLVSRASDTGKLLAQRQY